MPLDTRIGTRARAVAGAQPQGIYFNTWNGSAQVIPFSVGGQFNSAPSYVDNSGNLIVGGNLYEGGGGTGNRTSAEATSPSTVHEAHIPG